MILNIFKAKVTTNLFPQKHDQPILFVVSSRFLPASEQKLYTATVDNFTTKGYSHFHTEVCDIHAKITSPNFSKVNLMQHQKLLMRLFYD